jgi:hypothetical protein
MAVSVTPPTASEIKPAFFPCIKNQGSTGNCVAQSLSTAMEIFRYKKTKEAFGNGIDEHYSIAYIFGSDGGSEDWMYFEEAVKNCVRRGSPRWEMVSTYYPDNTLKAASVSLYNNANTDKYITTNASKQAFTGYRRVNFYSTNEVANYISTYGYFMFNFCIPNNFYDVGSDGIVPQPDKYSGNNHSMALIGLTTKEGKKHWIACNSWGTGWGAGGLCYIPYDWGCYSSPSTGNTTGSTSSYTLGGSSLSPEYSTEAASSWVVECYAVWNNNSPIINSFTPTIESTVQENYEKSIIVTWNGDSSNDVYLVFARQRGTINWYKKATVTTTTATISVDKFGAYEIMVIGLLKTSRVCSAQSSIANITIEEKVAYIEVRSTTTSSITVRLNNLDATWTSNNRKVHWFIQNLSTRNSWDDGTLNISGGIEYSPDYIFNTLDSGTIYYIYAKIFNSDTGVLLAKTKTIRVVTDKAPRPDNWNWYKDDYTKKAYKAITENGSTSNFSYAVWNELIDKVQEFLEYKKYSDITIGKTLYGCSSSTTYSAMLNKARMTTFDKVLTAKRFNIVRCCIGMMESTGLKDYSSGDPVYGYYFTKLTEALNKIE